MRIKIFIILLFLQSNCFAFQTLEDAKKYAAKMPEFPPVDNDNWLDPDYSSFHRGLEGVADRTFVIKRLLNFFNLRRKPLWSPLLFKSLLERVLEQRKKLKYSGDFIHKLTPKPNSRIIIWGDIQGAFHSLVRDLAKLEEEGVIDNNFKIVAPDTFFIFNGDLINRSPYILETLTLAMRLMEKNADKLFYIKGNHETGGLWHNFGLKRELSIRTRAVFGEKVALLDKVSSFFNSLPLALYIKSDDQEPCFVRISHEGREFGRLNEKYFSDFLLKKAKKRVEFSHLGNKKKNKFIDIKVIIKAVSRSETFELLDGLKLINQDQGSVAWTVLSSPTQTYNKLYTFFYDAFVTLQTAKKFHDWTITLHNQDIRKKDGFAATKYNLIFGNIVDERKDLSSFTMPSFRDMTSLSPEKTYDFTFGSTGDFSRAAITLGEELSSGVFLKVNEVNKNKGIRGKLLRISYLDDKSEPSNTLNNIDSLISDYKTDLIFSPIGSVQNAVIPPLVKSEKCLVLFPNSGSKVFRDPLLRNVINFRTSYANEAIALVLYAAQRLRHKKFAIFYQDDALGRGALAAAEKVLKKLKLRWVSTSYAVHSVKVKKSSDKIKNFDPQSILFFSSYAPSVELITKMRPVRVVGKTLLGFSYLTDRFRSFLHELGLKLTISRVVPNVEDTKVSIVKEYFDTVVAQNTFKSVDSLEGYINASLLVHALEKIDSPVTKEKMINFFENLKDYDFKGLKLDFDPATRELTKNVWIDTGEEWIDYSNDLITSKS